MKINAEYKLRSIAGETIVVNQGNIDVDMTHIISLNASAKLLYEELLDKDFSLDDAADILVQTYGIDHQQALADVSRWTEALKKVGIIE